MASVRFSLSPAEAEFAQRVGDLLPGRSTGVAGGSRWLVGWAMRHIGADRSVLVREVLGFDPYADEADEADASPATLGGEVADAETVEEDRS